MNAEDIRRMKRAAIHLLKAYGTLEEISLRGMNTEQTLDLAFLTNNIERLYRKVDKWRDELYAEWSRKKQNKAKGEQYIKNLRNDSNRHRP